MARKRNRGTSSRSTETGRQFEGGRTVSRSSRSGGTSGGTRSTAAAGGGGSTEIPVESGGVSRERATGAGHGSETMRAGARTGRRVARRVQNGWQSLTEPIQSGAGDMIRAFARDMNRFFDRWSAGTLTPGAFTGWPAIEMFDRDGRLVVRAEVPGMERQDVHVRLVGDALVLEGERRHERRGSGRGFWESEWSYGHFSRRILLPGRVDPEDVTAHFQNGVLEVSLRLDRPIGREIPIGGERGTSDFGT